MNPVFADSSFWVALLNPKDVKHRDALRWSEENTRPLVLTEFILVELGSALARCRTRQLFVDLMHDVRADPHNDIVPVSSELIDRGFRLFAERPDKDWSLTDCISFVVMRDRGLTDALTADRHFDQAGFSILLR